MSQLPLGGQLVAKQVATTRRQPAKAANQEKRKRLKRQHRQSLNRTHNPPKVGGSNPPPAIEGGGSLQNG
jgi:hypothetical protein